VLEAMFILLEFPSTSRRIFIGSHSLPPLWFAVSVLHRCNTTHLLTGCNHLIQTSNAWGLPSRRLTPSPSHHLEEHRMQGLIMSTTSLHVMDLCLRSPSQRYVGLPHLLGTPSNIQDTTEDRHCLVAPPAHKPPPLCQQIKEVSCTIFQQCHCRKYHLSIRSHVAQLPSMPAIAVRCKQTP
jgi:hypothetical protein